MGTISSGVGLISGLDFQSIVDQLIAIDARPRDQLQTRIGTIDAQRTAYADISARISGLLNRTNNLLRPSFFNSMRVNSSLPDVLSATANSNATTGSYRFFVRSTASTHQLVSSGFTSRTQPIDPGSLTIESAEARVDRATTLAELNGFTGVARGEIQIIDRSGAEATINVADAVTVNDVIQRINEAAVGVTARISDDGIVLEDTSGGTGTLRVRDVNGGQTAIDLGFDATNRDSATGTLAGRNLMSLAGGSALRQLRDGLGIRSDRSGSDFSIATAAGDFDVDLSGILKGTTRLQQLNHGNGVQLGEVRVQTRNGVSTTVDLSGAETVQDVVDAFGTVAGVNVTIGGDGLIINDTTDGGENPEAFTIEDLSGTGARDLGIAQTAPDTSTQIRGRDVLFMENVQDVLAAINYAVGNEDGLVTAAIAADGQRLELRNNFGGGPLTLTAGAGNNALADLGFQEGVASGTVTAGNRLVGGINSTLLGTLNGGRGIDGANISITANGQTVNVDATGAETLSDVVARVREAANNAGLDISVGLDRNGTRLQINNNDPAGGPLTISGDLADALGISGNGTQIRGDNLQRRYVSENTLLNDLNQGRGISRGVIRLTNGFGTSTTVNLSGNDVDTVGDVIDRINAAGLNIRAEINNTGDGIRLIDESGGEGPLVVADESGVTARDLNLLGSADNGTIDGSYEYTIEVSGTESLDDLIARINDTTLASANVINDGSGIAPYRLNLASRASGAIGELLIDGSALGVDFTTLSTARDARIVVGDDPANGLVVTSATNTFEDVVGGLSITVEDASDEPITVNVDRDAEAVLEAFRNIATDFNTIVDRIRESSSFDLETEARGVLLGENVPRQVQQRMFRLFTQSIPGATGTLRSLRDIGFELGEGTTLSFNEDRFREAYDADPQAVTQFFTNTENGAGAYLKEQLDRIAEADGLIDRRSDALESRAELMRERIETMNDRLDRKRDRLLRQFISMEESLALLQSQQNAIASFGAQPASTPNAQG